MVIMASRNIQIVLVSISLIFTNLSQYDDGNNSHIMYEMFMSILAIICSLTKTTKVFSAWFIRKNNDS